MRICLMFLILAFVPSLLWAQEENLMEPTEEAPEWNSTPPQCKADQVLRYYDYPVAPRCVDSHKKEMPYDSVDCDNANGNPKLCTVPKKHHWYDWAKDPKSWVTIGAAAGTSLYATHEITKCRGRNDLIHCPEGGYGPFEAREYGVRLPVSLGLAALTIYGREHWNKHWYDEPINDIFLAGWSIYNIKTGRANAAVPTFPKEDLSRISIRR